MIVGWKEARLFLMDLWFMEPEDNRPGHPELMSNYMPGKLPFTLISYAGFLNIRQEEAVVLEYL